MRYEYIAQQDNTPNMIDEGRLQVACFATDFGMPADGARARIMDGTKVIEELVTDSSGQTLEITLPAPPLEYSQQPNQPKPFGLYNVQVDMEGYEPCLIQGVQIFPDTTASQRVRLNPIRTDGSEMRTIAIKDHTLWGNFPPKIPEDAVKPLPPTTGFVVLREPVIPEYMIVHAGAPSDKNAPNYTVSFRDYVKNAACCEVYANWPEQTLKANILAIMSLALNRVFTEWYRGKGYNFTITNSTAVDQAFSYGRNIFDEISRIVDEIFTNYITKPGISQPLFTQYCDGNRSKCPDWLSQWGSKDLGDKGYSYIDILKTYYGHDVYLMQAAKVAGVPQSFAGQSLQTGSSGADVRVIQQQLNAISNNFPAIKKVKVDGIYGADTRAAVETFQSVFRLPASGIVDFATWYKISDIYVAVTKMAEMR